MKAQFKLSDPSYGLTEGQIYYIDFRSDGNTIFVDVSDLQFNDVGTIVFLGIEKFLDAWHFEGLKDKPRRVRKHIDFDTSLFFTSGETAELLGCTVGTINNWVADGRLRVHHRIPPRMDRRFAREDVMRLYESRVGGAEF